jgi:ankyrin repeat protein
MMADALDGEIDLDWASTGNINAQNQDGVTALMLLAANSKSDAIEIALSAGANAPCVTVRATLRLII